MPRWDKKDLCHQYIIKKHLNKSSDYENNKKSGKT